MESTTRPGNTPNPKDFIASVSNRPAERPIDIATLPFSGEVGDGRIAAALEQVLSGDSLPDKETVCIALLTSCKNNNLPESTRQDAKSFLLRFLEAMFDTPVNSQQLDVDQLIAQSLQKLVDRKFERTDSRIENQAYARQFQSRCSAFQDKKRKEYANEITKRSEDMYADVKGIQQIYAYLTDADQADVRLLDDVAQFICDSQCEKAKIICQYLSDSTKNSVVKEDAYQLLKVLSSNSRAPRRDDVCQVESLEYFIRTDGNIDKRPKTAFWLGCTYFTYSLGIHGNPRIADSIREKYGDNVELILQKAIAHLNSTTTHGCSDVNSYLSDLTKSVSSLKATALLKDTLIKTPFVGIDNQKLVTDFEQSVASWNEVRKLYSLGERKT